MSQAIGAAHPVRVTIVDDDDGMRALFREVLHGPGYDVTEFNGATADLDALLASDPDLIIVDLRLDPQRDELSGLQTIHAARTTEQLRNVPIVVCSADPTALSAAWPDFMERGDIHRLEIPFDLTRFDRVLAAALGRPASVEWQLGGTDVADADDSDSAQDG